VANCPACQDYIKSVKITVNICKDAYQVVPVPKDVKKNLLEKIRAKK